VLLSAGCRGVETHADYPADLYHPDYVRRSKAVALFAEKKDRSQLPQAFMLLLDDDAQIRLVAHETIRDLSPGGEDFGYEPYLPRDVRYGIVVRWQAWWEKGEGAPTKAAPPEAEASHG
jgi:hypothetical protein